MQVIWYTRHSITSRLEGVYFLSPRPTHPGHQGKAEHIAQESRQDERHASLFTSRHSLAEFTGHIAYLFGGVRVRGANLGFGNREPKRPVLIVLTFARAQGQCRALCSESCPERDGCRGPCLLSFGELRLTGIFKQGGARTRTSPACSNKAAK